MAGIVVPSGKWTRPVPTGGGAIPARRTIVDGHEVAPLDIVQMPLGNAIRTTRYQCKNREIGDWDWKKIGQVEPEDLLAYRSNSSIVLYNKGKVVEPSLLERLPPDEWRSLELVHAKNARFEQDPRKQNRWLVRFSRGRLAPEYCLGITDPLVTARLNNGENIRGECLLTISLTEPIELPKFHLPSLCYKVAAAVIEL